MEKVYQFCQSCGMPLTKDNGGGGTNADGGTSTMYCTLCYQQGKFLNPEFTAKAMQSFVQKKMRKQGFPAPLAWFFSLNVPHLARWKQTK